MAAHAVCVRTAMLSLCGVLNLLRSRLTKEYAASYFPKCNVATCVNPTAKV